jgi:hypothetical protein
MNNTAGSELVIDTASRVWRRRLGALAWAALEELALTAHPSEHGWVAPVGVRDVATGIGTTKDTAARAVAALGAAGLVTLSRVEGHDGRRRSGYRLQLPEGIELRSCPTEHDSPLSRAAIGCRPDGEDGHCPGGEDGAGCRPDRDSTPTAGTALTRSGEGRPPVTHTGSAGRPRRLQESAIQPALFAPPTTPPGDATP